MGPRRLAQRIRVSHLDAQLARGHEPEELAHAGTQVLGLGGVLRDRGARHEERALGPQVHERHGCRIAGGPAVRDDEPEAACAVEGAREGIDADAVVDDRRAPAAGDFLYLGDEVLLRDQHGVPATVFVQHGGLVRGPDRADDGDPEVREPLDEDQSHAARGRMHKGDVALADGTKARGEIPRREAAEERARGELRRHRLVGEPHDAVGGNHALLGVASGDEVHVGDAIAALHVADVGTHLLGDAHGAEADAGRQRGRQQAAADLRIDEVHADRLVAHAHFVRLGSVHGLVHPAHHLRAAGCLDDESPGVRDEGH